MGDAMQCAVCQRRTVGEFCGECVKKHAEIEELAARFLGPVITAEIMRTGSASARLAKLQRLQLALQDAQVDLDDASEEPDRRRALVQMAFDYAETFVAMRNERRRRA